MRKLTATLCLTIAVLLGSVGMSFGNDSRQASVASNAARCSSFYLIATSAFGSNKAAAKSLMGIQRLFDGLYSAKERARIGRAGVCLDDASYRPRHAVLELPRRRWRRRFGP